MSSEALRVTLGGRKMNKKFFLLVFLSVIVLAGLSGTLGYIKPRVERPAKKTIKIGALLCLSRECAEWGTESLRGLQLAAEEINSAGGVLGKRIELSVQDSNEINPARAVSAYQSIRQEGDVHYVVGPTWSPAGLALAPIAKRDSDVLVVSPSLGVRDFNESADNLFNVWPHDENATRRLARYAIAQGWSKAAIISSEHAWENLQGEVFNQAFKQLGGEVVVMEVHPDRATDLKVEVTRVAQSEAEFVFLANYQRMDVTAKELKRLQFSRPILTILMDQQRLKNAEGALDGALFANYPSASEHFSNLYQAEYGKQPGITADTAYDALQILARSMQRAGTENTKEVQRSIMSKRQFDGASGKIVFNKQGGVLRDPLIWRVVGMDYEPVA
jgi:branched-chain amino acid transport system substrate-binding protein